jgi:hypothetical protein
MFIRAVIAPSQGSAFVGGSSTTLETVSSIQVTGQNVTTILNNIVDEGSSAAWVLHSSEINDLSPSTGFCLAIADDAVVDGALNRDR